MTAEPGTPRSPEHAGDTPPRVVFDCNVLLQAIISRHGPASACVKLVLESRVILVTSPVVLAELRRMPSHPDLRRFPRLNPEIVEGFIAEVAAVAIEIPAPPSVFTYERDPKDAHYIDLAVAANAELVTSRDNDLLDLMVSGAREPTEFRRRFPWLRIVTPEALLREVAPRA